MEKKHFKLYKSGKQWLSMALVAVASLTLGMTMATVDGQADASIQNDAVATTQVADQSAQQSANATTAMATASQTTANTTNSSENQSNDSISTPTTTGLVQRNNRTYYYNVDSQSYATNTWANINNSWYHFGEDGAASTGWYQSQAGYWYYFNNTTSEAEKGWQNINNHWYHFDETNANAATGWYKSNAGYWYHFDETNAWANTGWYKSNAGYWYYFDNTNANALTGWQNINSHWYHFDEINANASTGWFKSQAGYWYHFDLKNAWSDTGWQSINNVWYYFDLSSTAMLTGTQTINGKTYHFNADGSWADDHSAAVAKAMSVRGTAYVWGGNNPSTGFDCSGLVQWAYGLGSNYRTTYTQQTLGAHHYDVANAPKGSLLFFGSDNAPYHVAISLGNGAYVHAPQPGDVVKVGYTKYYAASYYVVL